VVCRHWQLVTSWYSYSGWTLIVIERILLTHGSVLAPLHGLDYVSPSLVALAARKIYPHRLILVRPENERSLQWGSSMEAVQEALEGVGVEDIIEDVLAEVEVPV
jgi:hypothetical protein